MSCNCYSLIMLDRMYSSIRVLKVRLMCNVRGRGCVVLGWVFMSGFFVNEVVGDGW